MRKILVFCLFVSNIVLLNAQLTPGKSVVGITTEIGVNSLRSVIECAEDNDTITFDAILLSNSTIVVSDSQITIKKSIVLKADPISNITIGSILPLSEDVSSVFIISPSSDVTIEGLTIMGGKGPNGSAIKNYGGLVLRNVTLKKNGASGIDSIIENHGGLIISENCKIID